MKYLYFGVAILSVCLGVAAYKERPLPTLPPAPATRPVEQVLEVTTKVEKSNVSLIDIDLSKAYTVYLTSQVNVTSAKEVIKGIQEGNKKKLPIYLLLNSPGGSVIDGAHIISAMQASEQPVYTICLESCASMAAMILEYGAKRYAVDRSIIMFHPASVTTLVSGELDKIVSKFQFFQRYINKMDYYVAQRAGQTYETFKTKSNREHWIDSEDALNNNLIDGIVRLNNYKGDSENLGENRSRMVNDFVWE